MTRLDERIKWCERMIAATSGEERLLYQCEHAGLRREPALAYSTKEERRAYQRGLSDRATLLKLEER